MAARALFPLRAFSTARVARVTPASPFSPLGASSSAQPSSTTAPQPGSNSTLEQMLAALGQASLPRDAATRSFQSAKFLTPREFRQEHLLPRRVQARRPPLLGPTNKVARRTDPFYISGVNPVDHALNPLFVHQFVDPMGHIKKRSETGLTRKSQRLVAKMVRRARAFGIVHPYNGRPAKRGLGSDYNHSQ